MEDSPLEKKPGLGSGAGTSLIIPVKIAVYDNLRSIPRVVDSCYRDVADFINDISQQTYSISHEMGGKIPYTIIREVIENLIHADFREVIISIMPEGNHIMVSDQGPGIDDKEKALLPGYTSATTAMKKYIRGVGSGLPIVSETISFSGGSIDISDNIKSGTVISLQLNAETGDREPGPDGSGPAEDGAGPDPADIEARLSADIFERLDGQILSERQKKILFLILELEEAGPSIIAEELGFSLSTAYRELAFLEKNKLLSSKTSGKRNLSKKGLKYLEYYSNNL